MPTRVLIKDSDPKYAKYNLEYYHSHKLQRATIMKSYYERNAEALKAKRRARYAATKDAKARLAIEASITAAIASDELLE